MRRVRESSDDEDVPLHHKRPFGAGISRKQIEFVKAADPDAGVSAVSEKQNGALVGDIYASIVLGTSSSATPEPPGGGDGQADTGSKKTPLEKEAAAVAAAETAEASVCEICSLRITTSAREHVASLAHQVSLTHSHPPSALDRSRMGLRALASQGWDPDARLGLGREGEGMRFPVRAEAKEDTLGIGAARPVAAAAPEKPVRNLTARERKSLVERERRKNERLQAEMYGSVDVERYLMGEGGGQGLR